MDGWNTTFLLGRPIFRGYVSFREGTNLFVEGTSFTNTFNCRDPSGLKNLNPIGFWWFHQTKISPATGIVNWKPWKSDSFFLATLKTQVIFYHKGTSKHVGFGGNLSSFNLANPLNFDPRNSTWRWKLPRRIWQVCLRAQKKFNFFATNTKTIKDFPHLKLSLKLSFHKFCRKKISRKMSVISVRGC